MPKATGVELVYSRQTSDYIEGRAYSNPRFYTTPRNDVRKVFIVGDYPEIKRDYERMGVEVEVIGEREALAGAKGALTGTAEGPGGRSLTPPAGHKGLPEDERGAVQIPDNWLELPYLPASEGDEDSMRAIAMLLTDEVIINEEQAKVIIQAELDRRELEGGKGTSGHSTAGAPDADQGQRKLTKAEMKDQLDAKGVEYAKDANWEELNTLLTNANGAN